MSPRVKIAQGGYEGERTLRFEYKNQVSDWFEWMHIDPETLEARVREAGLVMERPREDARRYLVSITRR